MSKKTNPLTDFTGEARLFPLPGLVFFPQLLQPLHIFEPRYRQMTADALASDRLLALVLPRPGWEEDYEGKPALHRIACIGQIVASKQLPDGRYNLHLMGLSRARIIEELPDDKLYRRARVKLLSASPILLVERQQYWRQRLLDKLPAWFPGPPAATEHIRQALNWESVPLGLLLGALCDKIAYALPLDVEVKQELLEELDDEARLRSLFTHLDSKSADFFPTVLAPDKTPPRRQVPHDFSSN
jgi:uncharacterized protein